MTPIAKDNKIELVSLTKDDIEMFNSYIVSHNSEAEILWNGGRITKIIISPETYGYYVYHCKEMQQEN